jgi:hypothetical protein
MALTVGCFGSVGGPGFDHQRRAAGVVPVR